MFHLLFQISPHPALCVGKLTHVDGIKGPLALWLLMVWLMRGNSRGLEFGKRETLGHLLSQLPSLQVTVCWIHTLPKTTTELIPCPLILPCGDSFGLWEVLSLLVISDLEMVPAPAVAGPRDASFFLMVFLHLVYIAMNGELIKLLSIILSEFAIYF